jgi:predicted nicotinamide N-methyase
MEIRVKLHSLCARCAMPSSTTPVLLVSTETRWIEAESLHLDNSRQLSKNNDDGDDNDDDDEAAAHATLTDLFADPDPYETFTYQWNINVDTKSLHSSTAVVEGSSISHSQLPQPPPPPSMTTIDISVTGHKAENGQTLHSTGLTVWRASQILADWLVQSVTSSATATAPNRCSSPLARAHPSLSSLAQCSVLELGAGLGVPGLVCHWLGAPIVVWTDGDTDTLANLRDNVDRNARQDATTDIDTNHDVDDDTATRTRQIPHVSCRQLVWGNSEQINNVLHCLRSVVVGDTTADIESLPDGESSNNDCPRYFDVILGSDIIYVEHVIEPLFDTVAQLLDKRRGVFLLAYCRRNVSISLVLSAAQQRGMVWHEPDAPDGVYQFWYPPPPGGCSTR